MIQEEPEPPEYLAHRIFLDTSTLQTLLDFGGAVFEGENVADDPRVGRLHAGLEDLDALRKIFLLAERGCLHFIVSRHTFTEVAASGDARFLGWARDVHDHSSFCLSKDPPRPTASIRAAEVTIRKFGYLGAGDRQLITEAVALECDTFLTMERRLPSMASHLWRKLQLWVVRPTDLWRYFRQFPA